jgi:hypothetical protein
MSKRLLPILFMVIYGCSEKDMLFTPAAPQHYLEVSPPIISVSTPGPVKPMFRIQSADTIVTIKFLASYEDNTQVVAWGLGAISCKRIIVDGADGWESKYVTCPCPDKKLEAEFGPDCFIQGQRFISGTITFKKCGMLGVVVVASWSDASKKHSLVML